MILQPKQAKRFYRLYYALLVFANDVLHVSDRLLNQFGEINNQEIPKVADAIWGKDGNKDVITQFVLQNPFRLSRTDLNEIQRWEQGIYDMFTVDRRGRDVCFQYSQHLIVVRGLTREIDATLNQIPSVVNTVLLPFENAVVYGVSILEMPVSIGAGMLDIIAKETDEALAAGRLIRSGADFAKKAGDLRQANLDRQAEDFAHQTELDMNADAELPGQHRGVLAGLSPQERERAVRENADAHPIDKKGLADVLKHHCEPAAPVRTLDESYQKLTVTRLTLMARDFGLSDNLSSMKKQQLIDLVRPYVPTTRDDLLRSVRMAGAQAVRDLARLVAAGGMLTVRTSEIVDEHSVPLPMFPLILLYRQGSSFVAVMPDEILAELSDVDWDAEIARAQAIDDALKVIDLLVDMHGIVYLGEALDEVESRFDIDDDFMVNELLPTIMAASDDGGLACSLDRLGGDTVLIDYSLAQMLEDASDEVHDEQLLALLDQQEGKPFRHVTDEMLEAEDLVSWVMQTSDEAKALVAYLDEHVPDGEDDYTFADDVVGAIIDMNRYLMNPAEALHASEEYGFPKTEAQLKRYADLAMALCNASPKWSNNGWAPWEAREQMGR